MTDRSTPRMPPFTTLELLEREHKRLQGQAAAGVPDRKRSDREWHEHLAEVIWIRPQESTVFAESGESAKRTTDRGSE
jgi:hypothetical protein